MVDNQRMPQDTVHSRVQLPQVMALAMVVTWSVCAVADVAAGPTLLAMSQTTTRTGPSGELRTLDQWKGHLKLAARQFRLHPTPGWWLGNGSHALWLTWDVDTLDAQALQESISRFEEHRLVLQPLLRSHHLNLPPPQA